MQAPFSPGHRPGYQTREVFSIPERASHLSWIELYIVCKLFFLTCVVVQLIAMTRTDSIRPIRDPIRATDPMRGGYVWLPIEWKDKKPVIRWQNTWNVLVFGE